MQFPSDLKAAAIRIVHFSPLRLPVLVAKVHEQLSPSQAHPGSADKENARDVAAKQPLHNAVIKKWICKVCTAVAQPQSTSQIHSTVV